MLGTEALYTAAQTRALDQCAIHEHGIAGVTLMARAAAVAFRYLLELWPETDAITVFCGTGNNGGDGYLLADLAHKRGIAATVVQLGDSSKITGDALLAREQATANGVPVCTFTGYEMPIDGVLVDAMLGTGLGGTLRGEYPAVISSINSSNLPVLAIDIPSGICSDTGRVLGDAVRADLTVTFIGMKRGLFTFEAPEYTGAVQFADLEVPASVYQSTGDNCARLDLTALLERLPPRSLTTHKGHCGTVLVVGGDYGMAGAAAMAAEAALRCGAGLVSVATRPEHVAALVARAPEAMSRGVSSDEEFTPLLEAADVLVAGPGLGDSAWSRQLLHRSLASGKPVLLDADALTMRAKGVVEDPGAGARIMTPHPGEAARLLGTTAAVVQADRFAAIEELQARYAATVVLKGNGSLIADREQTLLSDYGNPGMASGGMGDVLSGVIGSLWAQGLTAIEAAALGTCLHGAAADIAAEEGQRGLLATDLLSRLRALLG